jgi:ABC-type nickel/cobalt efflux system permease component RcnA
MGVAVAAMHTASVVALALVVVSARWLFPPERVYPWMGLLAGFLAVIIGARLLVARVSAWRKARDPDHVHEHAHGPLSRRSLVALGAAGGILPSPTALLVLVGAAALDRLAFGIVLILGFSLGLAAALLGVGLAAVRVRELASRRSWVRAARLVPVLSAAAIVGLGSLVALRGLTQL